MKKKILNILTLICMVITLLSANITVSAYTGTKYGDYLYYTVSNGEVTITDCDSSATKIEIPPTINGYPVTGIGERAFDECDNLASVSIPDSVTSIGNCAFYCCVGLTSVSLPDSVTNIGGWAFSGTGIYNDDSNWNNNVLYIGNHLIKAKDSLSGEYTVKSGTLCIGGGAFAGCADLTNITIPDGMTGVCDYAFYDCIGLTSVSLPVGVTSIGRYAFYNCTGLTSITICGGVTSIRNSAFQYCNSLETVNITDIASWCNVDFGDCFANPLYYAKNLYIDGETVTDLTIADEVTVIKAYAFYGFSGLTNVNLSLGVTSVGGSAFRGCGNLISVSIPNSVTKIDDEAFYNCSDLTKVYYIGTEDEWNNISISGGNDYLTNAVRTYISEIQRGTQTFISGKTFTVTPINVSSGNTVIIALYNGETLVDTQSKIYADESLTFETEEDYTNAKVFVWESVNNIAPVCEPEIVK